MEWFFVYLCSKTFTYIGYPSIKRKDIQTAGLKRVVFFCQSSIIHCQPNFNSIGAVLVAVDSPLPLTWHHNSYPVKTLRLLLSLKLRLIKCKHCLIILKWFLLNCSLDLCEISSPCLNVISKVSLLVVRNKSQNSWPELSFSSFC